MMNEHEEKPDADEPLIEIRDDAAEDETAQDGQPGQEGESVPAEEVSTFASKLTACLRMLHFDPRCTVAGLDHLLDWARRVFPPNRFDLVADNSAQYGHYALVAAQMLALIVGFAGALKFSDAGVLFWGLGMSLLLVILQYTAAKFLRAGGTLIGSSPSRLSSAAFLDCLALLAEVVGILAFLSFLTRADLGLAFVGLGIWALCDAIAFIALNPAMANITIEKGVAAGEEAIGIMSFFVKAIVRIVPIAFGVGTILGAVALFFAFFSVITKGNIEPAKAALGFLVVCTCMPFASYVCFVLYHLAIDLMRSVLILPHKIDELKSSGD